MDPARMRTLLEELRTGGIDVDEGLARLARLPFDDLDHTLLDTHRALRCGHPEVVFGEGKTASEVIEIARRSLEHHDRLLVTRLAPESAEALARALPQVRWNPRSRTATVTPPDAPPAVGDVLVVSAGTSDAAVAEEATVTARMHGAAVEELRDVGVAGLHRLLAQVERLREADVLVVVAGMEGALPSVVGGLVERPVIAVPTSVGYGTSFGGVTALFAMLNSCAAGITVVNVDNGFGAGCAAARIVQLSRSHQR